MIMPFGKFKGVSIEDIPSDYLLWIAENVKEDTEINKRVVKVADREWHWREKNDAHFGENG